MDECIIIEDGKLIKTYDDVLWAGLFSVAHSKGEIVKYVQSCLPKNTLFILFKSDGNINKYNNITEYHNIDWSNKIQPLLDYAKIKNKKVMIGTLSQCSITPNINYVYLPLDDLFFTNGINYYFNKEKMPKWEERSNDLCWRGSCSGVGGINSIRARFVKKILDYNPNTNVRLSTWWSESKNIPIEYFSDRLDYTEFLKYKIFFIVDGNCIASNHMYGFASGCVPFLISKSKCWFSHLIKPYIHYIPIDYDLSDLIEKIEWVKNNDEQAKIIAENAYNFTLEYFSSEYQHKYIKETIDKYCIEYEENEV